MLLAPAHTDPEAGSPHHWQRPTEQHTDESVAWQAAAAAAAHVPGWLAGTQWWAGLALGLLTTALGGYTLHAVLAPS